MSAAVETPPETVAERVDQEAVDEYDLAALGHGQALSRKFDLWSILALSFCVLGTWSTFAQDLASGLTNGGPVAILWGLVLVTICNVAVAVSLGELCSSMPTALGQAYWVLRLWDTPAGRFGSYLCAWINTFGWWALTASQAAFMTSFILSLKTMFDPEWTGGSVGWVQFLVYLGVTALFTVFNLVACRKDKVLPLFNDFVGVWFAGLFVIFSLALLIAVGTKPDLSFQSGKFVFGTWINQTGWSDGVTWFTGLIQAAYGLTAFDSVIHMVEEIPAPRRNAPRAIWLSVVIGAISGFLFMVVCLFCIQDLDTVINADLPFMQLVQDAIGLQGGAALLSLFVFNGLGQGISIFTTGSRLTWSFSRDGGIPFSAYFTAVDPTWKVPARSILLQSFIMGLLGLLYLFANTVLEAILSTATIALTVSYGMPIAALMIAGRDKLPPGGFRLGRLGPLMNWISVIYCAVTTVFFFFPGAPSPAPADMNWAIVVFGAVLVVSISFWLLKGQHAYMRTADAAARLAEARNLEMLIHDGQRVQVVSHEETESSRKSDDKKL